MNDLKSLRNYFVFDSVPSTDFDLYVSGRETFFGPEHNLQAVQIPGKSGDLLRFDNRYENVTVNYPGWIKDDMRINLRSLRSFLLSRTSYARLEDTYHPDEFRLAVYSGGLSEPEVGFGNELASFSISFSCKPQRFLKEGERVQKFTTPTALVVNPSYFPSKPKLRIYGNGTLTIGNKTIEVIHNANTYLDLDCEVMNAYTGSTNRNSDVTTSDNDYITLPPGNTIIAKSSGISSFEVTPRWFYL